MKYTPKTKDKARAYTNRLMAGLALATSLATSYGCATVKHDTSKFGYNLVKVVDGGARFGTGASVGEKAGIYSSDINAPNYKAPEVYTGNSAGDRIGYIAMTPVLAIRQIGSGVGGMAESVYDVALGQFIPKNNNAGIVVDEILNPDKREGIPIIARGLNYSEENIGHVETADPSREQLKSRLDSRLEIATGSVPIVHPLGDETLPWYQRIARSIGNGVYYALFSLAGGSSSGEASGGVPGVTGGETGSATGGM